MSYTTLTDWQQVWSLVSVRITISRFSSVEAVMSFTRAEELSSLLAVNQSMKEKENETGEKLGRCVISLSGCEWSSLCV